MLVWAAFYQLSVGTVCYSELHQKLPSHTVFLLGHSSTIEYANKGCLGLVAELSTRRLQIKTVAFGRVCYAIVAIITNVLTPRMLNVS